MPGMLTRQRTSTPGHSLAHTGVTCVKKHTHTNTHTHKYTRTHTITHTETLFTWQRRARSIVMFKLRQYRIHNRGTRCQGHKHEGRAGGRRDRHNAHVS
jgi:hypothetical protein